MSNNLSILLLWRNEPKRIRKQIVELNRHPQQRLIQKEEIAKPKVVTLTNGLRVPYEGP